jgi:glycosyltransferase involved in cell wall biosynthesis
MSALQNKNILVLSPQSWGKLFVSKHHYAVELAKRGNRVYFLDPPEQGRTGLRTAVDIRPLPDAENLFLVRHRLWFPYILKFHALPLFHAGMRRHIGRVLKEIGVPIDIVWSFDLGNLYPWRFFSGVQFKVFHPVDEPLTAGAIASAKGSDVIFSVTTEILEKYKKFNIPGYFINHGVAEHFLDPAGDAGESIADPLVAGGQAPGPVKVGIAGNLLREDLDREIFLRIVRENPTVQFECWGSYKNGQSNIGGVSNSGTSVFIESLLALPNIKLHGPVSPDELAAQLRGMDAFLICYDVQKDQSRGTNYHKVMEFISTGKIVVSNNVTTYRQRPDLIQMVDSRENNEQLPALFKKVAGSLDHYNSPELQAVRKAFARDNSYVRQVDRIEAILDQTEARSPNK